MCIVRPGQTMKKNTKLKFKRKLSAAMREYKGEDIGPAGFTVRLVWSQYKNY